VVIHDLEQVNDVAVFVFVNLEAQPVLLVQSDAKLPGSVAAEFFGLQAFDRVEDAFVLGCGDDLHDDQEPSVNTFGQNFGPFAAEVQVLEFAVFEGELHSLSLDRILNSVNFFQVSGMLEPIEENGFWVSPKC
jgi:hypothetical protein